MQVIVQGRIGQVFHAEGHPDFLRIRPVYCFVQHGQASSAYLASPWPSINSGANPNAIGSHVFPDWNRPVRKSDCPILKRFLQSLPRYIGKASAQ